MSRAGGFLIGERVVTTDAQDCPIDSSYLKKVTGDDEDFQRELVQSYMDSSHETLARLRRCVASGDAAEIFQAAHSLKGGSRAIGAGPMGAACEALERQAQQGDLADSGELLSSLEQNHEALCVFIRKRWLS